MKRILFILLLAVGTISTFNSQLTAQDMSDQTVVEIAAGNTDFSTLVTAIKAADLAETLSGDGPFTVFAPTNAAFAALPDGLVAALLKPENKEILQQILTYHVVSAKLMASDVVAGIESGDGMLNATTVSGGQFDVMTEMGKVKIKDAQGNVATVTATDLAGSNGIIHVIDRVMLPAGVDPAALLMAEPMMAEPMMDEPMMAKSTSMPAAPAGPSIAEVASGNKDFSTLVTALGAAGLVETFSSAGDYTVFAPTNAAFDKLPEGTVTELVTNQQEQLKGILAYHVIPARLTSTQLVEAITANKNYYHLQTLGGKSLVATITDGKVQLIDDSGNRSTVIVTDVEASNGIIHGIDTVVLPK
jgi:uncharacterized surface protein with fasciclin (FAS1) repeats